jgi:hypothetical protein
MKAITIWQPWASLIVAGAKPYEFRSWHPPKSLIGQRIAIHAGARPMKRREVIDILSRMQNPDLASSPCLHVAIATPLLNQMLKNEMTIPLSHILCTAELGQPKSGEECAREFGDNAGNDSDREGTFNLGWPLLDIEPLVPPAPARGAQGFWNWSGE